MGASLSCIRPHKAVSTNEAEQKEPQEPQPVQAEPVPEPPACVKVEQRKPPSAGLPRSPSASDKDSAYRQGYLVENLASCSSGPSSASDTSSLFSTARCVIRPYRTMTVCVTVKRRDL